MSKVYYNGTILTMEGENDTVDAVLVSNGRIQKTGTVDEIKKEAAQAEWVDLQGRTLMPAFIDGHSHISMAIQTASTCDLSDCESFEAIIEKMKAFADQNHFTEKDVIMGMGYDHNFLPGGKHPTKEVLDQISETIPVMVMHTSNHMACANSVLLSIAGVDENTPDLEGGCIGRVEDSREPNGYLEEGAMLPVQMQLADRMHPDILAGARQQQTLYAQYGVTTVQDGAAVEQTVQMMQMLCEKGLFELDVVSYPLMGKGENPADIFEKYAEHAGKYKNHFKLGGYKAVLDGSPQGKSAWLSKPYENSGDYCGYPWFRDEEVEEMMKQAVDDGQQILVHCNGDAAGDQFLRCYENAAKKSENADWKKLRPVMIHCQTARKDQLEKMTELGMIPSIFVGHVYYWGDVHLKNLGEERGSNISPCRTALDLGLSVNFHQDTPVTKPDMLHSVWAAVNRRSRNGREIGPWQKISVYEGLKAITVNAAYAYFEEDIKGTITEGKYADLVILDRNPMKEPVESIKDIQVLETVKEGKTIFKRLEN